MKAILLSLSVSLIILSSSFASQGIIKSFTIQEMQTLSNKNSADFETFVLNKGFSFDGYLSTTDWRYYKSDMTRSNGNNDQIARKLSYDSSNVSVEYLTTDKATYMKFKSSMVTLGYKFVKESPLIANVIWYYYYNGKYTAIVSNHTNYGINWYRMEVYKGKHII